MEIEFNTGRIPQAESSPQAAKRTSVPDASAAVSFSASDSLKSQLSSLSAPRPEAVAKGKQLVADASYPPDYLLDRVAKLLAISGNSSSSVQSNLS